MRRADVTVDGTAWPTGRWEPRVLLTSCWRFARRVLLLGPRKLHHAVERRRTDRIRRNPIVPTTALRSAKTVLIVCHGNIIRSAFAARLVAQTVGEEAVVTVLSGGLEATPGDPSPPTAVSTAIRLGVDLSGHVSAAVTSDTTAAADVIFVMDVPQLVSIRKRFRAARDRTFLLTCLAPHESPEVRDPVDGDESVFQECFNHIARSIRPIAAVLSTAARPQRLPTLAAAIERSPDHSCSR